MRKNGKNINYSIKFIEKILYIVVSFVFQLSQAHCQGTVSWVGIVDASIKPGGRAASTNGKVLE